jgi:hypothetical protein
LDYRGELLTDDIAYKTSRNVIDSTFRAIHRDARLLDYRTAFGSPVPITEDVFALLTWDPKKMRRGKIDPFTHESRPIFLDTFTSKHWRKALRACTVRPRKFYCTRHRYISLAVSAEDGHGSMSAFVPLSIFRDPPPLFEMSERETAEDGRSFGD